MKVYIVFKNCIVDGTPQVIRVCNDKDFIQKVVDMSNAQNLHLSTPYYIEEHEMLEVIK